jgi:hypothetical protein
VELSDEEFSKQFYAAYTPLQKIQLAIQSLKDDTE